jgi:hypothetical protein
MTTGRTWSCCRPIVARGPIVGSHRRLYALHSESCPAPLLRRATRVLWVEVPHLTFPLAERWPPEAA